MNTALILLCVKIFFIRILDVSLGTIRAIITVKGKASKASFVGFFEVLIWFIVVREALNTPESSIFIALSYSAGYATGTFIGSLLCNKFIDGNLTIQAILSNNDDNIVNSIRKAGYAVSVIDVKGLDSEQPKYMLFMEINKKRLTHLKKLIKDLDERAFIVVNETKMVHNGYFK